MNPFATFLEPVLVPEWAGARRVHCIADDDPVAPAPTRSQLEETKALLARAAATVAAPRPRQSQAKYVRKRMDAAAAARGEVYLPLEPGQKRRRRAGPDGKPLKRGSAGYVRSAEPIAYNGPTRAPGEMTYAEARRIEERAERGERLDLEDIDRAMATLAKAREAGVPA